MTPTPVLDHGFVELVASMGGDLAVVNSARVSYGKRREFLDGADEKLIGYLAAHNHTSPFRHVQLQFHVKAPEFVARQWYKHAIGAGYTDTAWNEISQRYVEVELEFYEPETWRKQTGKQESGGVLPETHQLVADLRYSWALEQCQDAYRVLLENGVAREQARMVLPLSVYTEFYWTASLQAVAHFIHLRDEPTAQFEIQEYARAVRELALGAAPKSLEALLSHA